MGGAGATLRSADWLTFLVEVARMDAVIVEYARFVEVSQRRARVAEELRRTDAARVTEATSAGPSLGAEASREAIPTQQGSDVSQT